MAYSLRGRHFLQVYLNKAGEVVVRVSWLYRPQEAVSQGAKPPDGWRPNEIMFSRHFDTLDPYTVLHPCQVTPNDVDHNSRMTIQVSRVGSQ